MTDINIILLLIEEPNSLFTADVTVKLIWTLTTIINLNHNLTFRKCTSDFHFKIIAWVKESRSFLTQTMIHIIKQNGILLIFTTRVPPPFLSKL